MLIALALLHASAADVDPFRPAGSLGSGHGTLQGESPFILGEGFGFGLHASFAQDLAVRRRTDRPDEPLVASVLPLELAGAYTLEDRGLRIEAFAPVYADVRAPGSDFSGAALGDLRVQANIRLIELPAGVTVGIVPRIELPTGSRAALTRRGFQAGVTGTIAGELPNRLGWLGNAGLTLAGADDAFGVGLGTTVDLLAGGYWRATDSMRIGAEVDSQVGLVKRASGRNHTATWHAFAQNRLPSGIGLTVGAGTGLVGGVGAPTYRVFSALTYQVTVRDTDEDGLLDKVDACPTNAEDLDGFDDTDGCPDVDNDADGILDTDDACPDDAEDPDGFDDTDGCPEFDNDADGILDTDDVCPLIPGEAELQGCPDRDGDGITDTDDACPDAAGPIDLQGCPDRDLDKVPDNRDACPDDPIPPSIDPATSDGCPKLAYLTGGTISIFEKVNFETGKAIVAESSFALLDAVATVFQDNPTVKQVEVAGHTDNVGSERYNQRLSQKRSEAVRSYLIGKGIAADRLTAKGYGEAKPLTTNRTDEGKARNRRVEFTVTEQTVETTVVPQLVPGPGADSVWDVPVGTGGSTVVPAPAPSGSSGPPPASVWDTPQPVVAPVPQPQPVAPAPQPVVAPAPQPIVAPAPQPVVAPTPQPIVAPAPQPGSLWDAPTPTPTPAARPKPEPTTPWDAPKPAPAVTPSSAPVPSPAPVAAPTPAPVAAPTPAPVAAPTPAPAPAPVVAPAPVPAAPPTSARVADPDAPAHPATTDRLGDPAKLTIQLTGDLSTATVYIDSEPLPRSAPLTRFPILAGEHRVWIQDDASGLDHEETLVFHNGESVLLVLPLGAGAEPITGPTIPAVTPKRGKRRDRKR